MKITIMVPEHVSIPDAHLLELAATVRERFELSPGTPVHAEDLVQEAILMGYLPVLPEGWWVKDDEEYSDDDLRDIAKGE